MAFYSRFQNYDFQLGFSRCRLKNPVLPEFTSAPISQVPESFRFKRLHGPLPLSSKIQDSGRTINDAESSHSLPLAKTSRMALYLGSTEEVDMEFVGEAPVYTLPTMWTSSYPQPKPEYQTPYPHVGSPILEDPKTWNLSAWLGHWKQFYIIRPLSGCRGREKPLISSPGSSIHLCPISFNWFCAEETTAYKNIWWTCSPSSTSASKLFAWGYLIEGECWDEWRLMNIR